jgi:hypothetical protein
MKPEDAVVRELQSTSTGTTIFYMLTMKKLTRRDSYYSNTGELLATLLLSCGCSLVAYLDPPSLVFGKNMAVFLFKLYFLVNHFLSAHLPVLGINKNFPEQRLSVITGSFQGNRNFVLSKCVLDESSCFVPEACHHVTGHRGSTKLIT